jgi:hypothetical protein
MFFDETTWSGKGIEMTLKAMIVPRKSQSFATLYNDKGSGGDTNLQLWHPDSQTGFLPVGDVAEASPSPWIYDSNPPLEQVILIGPGTDASEVANPLDFTLVWSDTGTGADLEGAIWSMVCPSGYVALGYCCTFSTSGTPPKPDTSQYYCVKAAGLTTTGLAGAQIWNTANTGADTDYSLYQVTAGVQFINCGTFVGQPGFGPPSGVQTSVLLPTAVTF